MSVVFGFRLTRFSVLVFCIVSTTLALRCSASSSTKLPPKYSEWLKKDVACIITNDERQAFRALSSDEAREKFIEHFWEIRNPNPGAPTNQYREEHYQRLQYASDHFGSAFAFLCLAGIATLGLATVALFMQETRPADEPAVA